MLEFNLPPIISHDHEHFDCLGYPDGLHGQAIPRLARIVAVCDADDALVRPIAPTVRQMRRPRSFDDAGKQWDPEIVDLFVSELGTINRLVAAASDHEE